MKIYMVQASWYDDVYESYESCNLAAFGSIEAARYYIDTFPEINEAAGRRLDKLLEERGYKPGQTFDNNDKELMDAFYAHVSFGDTSYDEIDLWISEYDLRE